MGCAEKEILFKAESYEIVGACIQVHSKLGPGFLEGVYHEALVMEFENRMIPYELEKELKIYYGGRPLKKKYS